MCEDILAPLADGNEVDIFPIVTHAALDIICETAMGRSINAQQCSDTDYVRAIYEASELVFVRQRSPWIWGDWAFALSPTGARYNGLPLPLCIVIMPR
jgi:cytochrome P450 family 4 subfamily V